MLFEENSEPKRFFGGSIDDLRNYIVGSFMANVVMRDPSQMTEVLSNPQNFMAMANSLRDFLPAEEVSAIVRDHTTVHENGVSAIGADSIEEANKKIGALMVAIGERLFSNIRQRAAADGFLSVDFNTETNEFDFTPTEKGIELMNSDINSAVRKFGCNGNPENN